MGYSKQNSSCPGSISSVACADSDYEIDTNLVEAAIGTLLAKTPSGTGTSYFLASRRYVNGLSGMYSARIVNIDGGFAESDIYDKTTYLYANNSYTGEMKAALRPILTLKADIQIKSGDGKSANTAYQLK